MHLAAGLHPDPLRAHSTPPDPLASLRSNSTGKEKAGERGEGIKELSSGGWDVIVGRQDIG